MRCPSSSEPFVRTADLSLQSKGTITTDSRAVMTVLTQAGSQRSSASVPAPDITQPSCWELHTRLQLWCLAGGYIAWRLVKMHQDNFLCPLTFATGMTFGMSHLPPEPIFTFLSLHPKTKFTFKNEAA